MSSKKERVEKEEIVQNFLNTMRGEVAYVYPESNDFLMKVMASAAKAEISMRIDGDSIKLRAPIRSPEKSKRLDRIANMIRPLKPQIYELLKRRPEIGDPEQTRIRIDPNGDFVSVSGGPIARLFVDLSAEEKCRYWDGTL